MIFGTRKKDFSAVLKVRDHEFVSDVLEAQGGGDAGPSPHEMLEGALAACTIITLQMYATRKQWPLESADVSVEIEKEGSGGTVILRKVNLRGDLTEEQKKQLLDIANRCPVHRLLTGSVEVRTERND